MLGGWGGACSAGVGGNEPYSSEEELIGASSRRFCPWMLTCLSAQKNVLSGRV